MSTLLAFLALLNIATAGPSAPLDVSLATVPARVGSWKPVERYDVRHMGNGVGIVFSPDLAASGNRVFYESLGFTYIESADWNSVLSSIRERNLSRDPIDTLIIESHGTNGTGLKLQSGHAASDDRSYIALAALQEKLEPAGIRYAVISACNAGRLFRPSIYRKIRPDPKEPLFLPATRGIVNASSRFDPASSDVVLLRRQNSNMETLVEGEASELDVETRALLRLPARTEFVISTMLIQLVTGDPELQLTGKGYVVARSRSDLPKDQSEALFSRFTGFLDRYAKHSPRPRFWWLTHGRS